MSLNFKRLLSFSLRLLTSVLITFFLIRTSKLLKKTCLKTPAQKGHLGKVFWLKLFWNNSKVKKKTLYWLKLTSLISWRAFNCRLLMQVIPTYDKVHVNRTVNFVLWCSLSTLNSRCEKSCKASVKCTFSCNLIYENSFKSSATNSFVSIWCSQSWSLPLIWF